MKVKLLKDVMDGAAVKMVTRRNRNWTSPKVVDGKVVESEEPQFIHTVFSQGLVVEASDATAAKWIKKGLAKKYIDELSK